MKVLILSEMSVPHATGGGETRYGLLSRQLAIAGHDVTWLSMRQRQSGREERIDGVRHLHRGPLILNPPTRSLWAKLHFMAAIFLHLLWHRYEVVDCQTYAPLPAAWLACRLMGMPLVATIHDTAAPASGVTASDQWLSALDGRLAAYVERSLYRLSYSRVLTGSHEVKADLVTRMGLQAEKVSVVPNAIDLAHIDTITAHPVPVDLIFVGRMVPHKHPEAFLQAAAIFNHGRRAAGQRLLTLRMIGAGPLTAQVRAWAQELQLDECLDFRGELESHDEVIAHIKSARLLVLPSTREGFGLVLTEAMACRTAIVAYRLPPVAETVGPELQDCLCDPGDIAGLAQVIASLMDDEARRLEQVKRGRKRVATTFGAQRFGREVLAVYLQAAGSLPPSQPRDGQNSA